MTIDPDRLKRVHVKNVRYDNTRKLYLVTLYHPVDKDSFEVLWDTFIKQGPWENRKENNIYY